MMHLTLPVLLSAALIGIGTFGVLARRNAVLVLIGIELILNGSNLLLVAIDSVNPAKTRDGSVLTIFSITIAAAEICVALAVILAMFRIRGDVDVTAEPFDIDADSVAEPKGAQS